MSIIEILSLTILPAVLPIYRSGALGAWCNGTIMADNQRNAALIYNGAVRTDLQIGLSDKTGKFYPTAKYIYDFVWSCELEEIANKFVQSCPMTLQADLPEKHAINFRAFSYNAGVIYEYPLSDAVTEWQIQPTLVTGATNIYRPDIKEFSNIVNSATLAVGCSEQMCGGGIVASAACAYEQPPLTDGQAMYEIGPPCSSDANCTLYTPATCNLIDRLCVWDTSTTNAPTTSAPTPLQSSTSGAIPSTSTTVHSQSTTTTRNAHVNPEINQICPGNGEMNDRIRVKAVDMHNYRRSQLATGKVAKFNGNKLPKAANMIKLRYDCELEKAAFAHAAACSNSNSDQGLSSDIKRNTQMVPQSTATYRVDAISEAIKTWWKQIRLQTQAIGMAVTFKTHHVNLPIRFFTMMAWAATSNLGCGVASCSGSFFVVCHYQPGGNVVNTQVYTPGDPCFNCPTGTYCVSPLCSAV